MRWLFATGHCYCSEVERAAKRGLGLGLGEKLAFGRPIQHLFHSRTHAASCPCKDENLQPVRIECLPLVRTPIRVQPAHDVRGDKGGHLQALVPLQASGAEVRERYYLYSEREEIAVVKLQKMCMQHSPLEQIVRRQDIHKPLTFCRHMLQRSKDSCGGRAFAGWMDGWMSCA